MSGTDTAAAAANSTKVSVSNCATRRPRPAPTASRVAISRRRVAARASSMPATLLHAMASRAPVNANRKPMNARNGVRTGPGMRPIGATAIVCRGFARGSNFLNASISVLSSACAWPISTPGLRRPIATCHAPRGSLSRSALESPRTTCTIANGVQRSVPTIDEPWKPGSATPTTANSRLFRRSGLVRMSGSLLKRVVQKWWLNTTTGRSPGTCSSSARKKRPTAARVPSTSK